MMETIQKSDISHIIEKLGKLQEDVDYLKKHIVQIDSEITEQDKVDFDEYEREKREGRLLSEQQLKKELDL